jgi:hypothetical protein
MPVCMTECSGTGDRFGVGALGEIFSDCPFLSLCTMNSCLADGTTEQSFCEVQNLEAQRLITSAQQVQKYCTHLHEARNNVQPELISYDVDRVHLFACILVMNCHLAFIYRMQFQLEKKSRNSKNKNTSDDFRHLFALDDTSHRVACKHGNALCGG